MHAWKTFEKRKKEMKTSAVLLVAWNFFYFSILQKKVQFLHLKLVYHL